MEQEKYLPELMAEKDSLDHSFVHAMRLLAEGKFVSVTMWVTRYLSAVFVTFFRIKPLMQGCLYKL